MQWKILLIIILSPVTETNHLYTNTVNSKQNKVWEKKHLITRACFTGIVPLPYSLIFDDGVQDILSSTKLWRRCFLFCFLICTRLTCFLISRCVEEVSTCRNDSFLPLSSLDYRIQSAVFYVNLCTRGNNYVNLSVRLVLPATQPFGAKRGTELTSAFSGSLVSQLTEVIILVSRLDLWRAAILTEVIILSFSPWFFSVLRF